MLVLMYCAAGADANSAMSDTRMSQGPAALTGGETTATPAVQQAVAAFNQAGRRKTLVEQHQERLKKKKQKQVRSRSFVHGCTFGMFYRSRKDCVAALCMLVEAPPRVASMGVACAAVC